MRVIFFSIVFCALVNGDCIFRLNDSKDLQDKIKKWKIYNSTVTIRSKTSTYQLGICLAPNTSNINGAIIQTINQDSSVYVLGQINQIKLVGGDNWILLTYENGSHYSKQCDNKTRSASLMFVCGRNMDTITVVQEHTSRDEQCNYLFQFQIPEMCPVVPEEKKGMSGGAIFLITIFCLACAYLVGGFLFMRLKRGARGIDQIPNLEMWRKLGHFTADGCDFCYRCKTNVPGPGSIIDEIEPDIHDDDDILAP
ncbi:unnamed protein product [Rotaria magnacalcarata]|uniref:MRH domain-containing protein n=1 Tax=Rotaria magnacalcarata TaxID=392030 RepID=A0A816NK51_9BILA|nr:unnamed protein product [Rotaria magnacalcarata]CAF2070262.1 unnamed protein product [Rotaria magnacalcarata]CAF3917207.1 unnamed protein product [Rotaria magnacalcarata]CAF3918221.1 unnamed protein product [Rotaria magnacalcarata]